MKKQSEIRLSPLRDPVRVSLILSRDQLSSLKSRAAYHDTTVNEIIRSLISDYIQSEACEMSGRIYYRVRYGVTLYDPDERIVSETHEHMSTLYTDIETARRAQDMPWRSCVDELQHKTDQRRRPALHGKAYTYIESVTGVSDDTPDGRVMDMSELPGDIQRRLRLCEKITYIDGGAAIRDTPHW